MRLRVTLFFAWLWCWAIAVPVRAEPSRSVEVRVIDIAGGNAYLSAGAGKGLRVGTRVSFGRVERRVEKATHGFSVVSAQKLRVGARGLARVSGANEEKSERLPTPRPLSAFAGMWPEAQLPSTQQHVEPVRLGRMQAESSRAQATLTAGGVGLLPLDGKTEAVGRGDLRARVSATPVPSWPLAFDADVAVQQWFGRYATGVASGDPRPWWRVRELAMTLGYEQGYRAQLGRVRYAAANLGPIDGARLEAAQWGPMRVATFGGMLPDPIDGRFATGAGRFGLELGFRGEQAFRPELTVVAQGSSFNGRIDERRLFAQAAIWPGEHRLGAYAEASAFDKDNPWGRPTAEITAAGSDFELRFAALRFGGRFDMRKPERSYWLANSFPRTWLCSSTSAFDPNIACAKSDDTRYVAQGYGGYDLSWVSLDVGGAWSGSSEAALGQDTLGYATLRFPRVADRYDLALGGSHENGSLLQANTAARAEFGVGWLDERVRLTLYYRPAYRRYQASVAGLWEQGGGASLHVAPTPRFAFDLFGDTRIGDVDMALVMLTAMVRLGT